MSVGKNICINNVGGKMGADYLIFTDVSTDIDKEMLKKYDI